MSDSSTPRQSAAQQQPKQMSSRLLTMKFMQRATARSTQPSRSQSSPISTTLTPNSNQSYSPSSEQNSSKRRKIDSPSTYSSPTIDRTTITAALKAEAEAQSAAARKLNLKEGGETEWVLDIHLPLPNKSRDTNGHLVNGHNNRHEDVETSSDEDENESNQYEEDIWSNNQPSGRQIFGTFKRRHQTSQFQEASRKNDLEDGEISSASDDDSTTSSSGSNFNSNAELRSPLNASSSQYTQNKQVKPGPQQRRQQQYSNHSREKMMESKGPISGLGRSRSGSKKQNNNNDTNNHNVNKSNYRRNQAYRVGVGGGGGGFLKSKKK